MKQLSTTCTTFVVQDVVADAVLELAAAGLSRAETVTAVVPVVTEERPDEVRLLIGPGTQLVVSSSAHPDVALSASGMHALHALEDAAAALTSTGMTATGTTAAFVDFDAYPLATLHDDSAAGSPGA
jgi:hypothetical protein